MSKIVSITKEMIIDAAFNITKENVIKPINRLPTEEIRNLDFATKKVTPKLMIERFKSKNGIVILLDSNWFCLFGSGNRDIETLAKSIQIADTVSSKPIVEFPWDSSSFTLKGTPILSEV